MFCRPNRIVRVGPRSGYDRGHVRKDFFDQKSGKKCRSREFKEKFKIKNNITFLL